ncbi:MULTISPECIES: Tn3 family transposase [Streptomyces]|uniref:Tn3 family transposase n=1 Tax=Streptomyces TaxID=1883 RepID=UPI0016716D49
MGGGGGSRPARRLDDRGGRPTPLGTAFAEYGRIAKTEHLVRVVDPVDDIYRRQMNRQLTVQESRHKLARDVCHGKRCTIRQAYRDGMEDQLGALGLVLNAIVLWTTSTSTPPSPSARPKATSSGRRTPSGSPRSSTHALIRRSASTAASDSGRPRWVGWNSMAGLRSRGGTAVPSRPEGGGEGTAGRGRRLAGSSGR